MFLSLNSLLAKGRILSCLLKDCKNFSWSLHKRVQLCKFTVHFLREISAPQIVIYLMHSQDQAWGLQLPIFETLLFPAAKEHCKEHYNY